MMTVHLYSIRSGGRVNGMTYKRFEDLPVWNDAAQLAADLFEFTRHPAFRGRGDLANQMQRAGLSISNHIAEGFERGASRRSGFRSGPFWAAPTKPQNGSRPDEPGGRAGRRHPSAASKLAPSAFTCPAVS